SAFGQRKFLALPEKSRAHSSRAVFPFENPQFLLRPAQPSWILIGEKLRGLMPISHMVNGGLVEKGPSRTRVERLQVRQSVSITCGKGSHAPLLGDFAHVSDHGGRPSGGRSRLGA